MKSKKTQILSYFFAAMTGFGISSAPIADIYKQVDKDGNVIFSDVPSKKGQKPIQSTPGSKYQPRPNMPRSKPSTTQSLKPKPSPPPTTRYQSLNIINPKHDTSVRANGGILSMSVSTIPPLNQDAKHKYVIFVDGARHQETQQAQFQLRNIERGSHKIGVQIQDNQNRVLANSSTITVHVQRTSILFKGKR